ncbi:MAG: cupin domain-containing protein [Bacteroidia bacterium]
MKIESFNEKLDFNDNRIVTKVLLESSFSKEIRILLKQGQIMKEHKAPYPIIVHVLEGEINFGVQGDEHLLKAGDIITLTANIAHDLAALRDSIIRLTLSKLDKTERIEKVVTG